jgi:nucleotide-binding universal stress UspA family protein
MNFKIQKILVPVDLSESSLNALQVAIDIAKKKKASVKILHVIDNRFYFYPRPETNSQFSNDSLTILTALANSIQKMHGIKPEVGVERGDILKIITVSRYLEQFDLIVAGTHGESGYRDNFIGSTIYNLIKYSTCTVLAIPPDKQLTEVKKTIFPIRPVTSALSAYDIVCHFLSIGSKLEILGLTSKNAEGETKLLENLVDQISEKLKADKIIASTTWSPGNNIADDIIKIISQSKVGLLIITAALDVTTKPYFIGPHTQKVLNQVKIPMLCIKQPGLSFFG